MSHDPHITDLTTAIHGARQQPLETHIDPRGGFTEVFRQSWDLPVRPSQWSIVTSNARALRGMHLHREHDEYFALIRGRGCVGLYDIRPDSPTVGNATLIEVDSEKMTCIGFPRGVLHGWYFYEDSLHLQATSAEYGDYHPQDNIGCLWSDPELKLPWPDATPILSERAAAFPPLADLRRRLQGS